MNTTSRGFVIPRPNTQSKIRLFCFPYSGAAASIYYPWSDILPGSIEVCSYQYPGHGTRVSEELLHRITDLVDMVLTDIHPYLDKEYAFYGHSLGAMVAFELARSLQRQNQRTPTYLFVSGHNAPHIEDAEKNMHTLPHDQFIEKLRDLNGTPEEILQNEELLELLLPILRADFSMSETYFYNPANPLDCPICVCGGLMDKYTDRVGLDAWRIQTYGGFSLRMFQGDHFFLNQSRPLLLQVIAQEINRYIPLGSR